MRIWKSVNVYVRGKGHVKEKLPCQDRTYSIVDKSIAVISLADGAGFYTHSQIGAEIAVKTVCEFLKKEFNSLYKNEDVITKHEIHNKLYVRLKKTAKSLSVDLDELSSTLLFVAVKEDKFIAGHIGDGVIGVLGILDGEEEEVEVLSHPENGEYANETYFVTSPNAINHFRITKGEIDNTIGFILMSDGSSETLYDTKEKTLSKASKRILGWMDKNDAQAVKKALRKNVRNILRKYTSDDCSINLLKFVEVGKDETEKNDDQIPFSFCESFPKSSSQKGGRFKKLP